MAVIKPNFQDTFVASADLSTKQYRFVKVSGDGRCTVCSGTTDVPLGVLQDTPPAESGGLVMLSGITKIVAGGDIAAGELVCTDGNGAAVKFTPGTDTTKYGAGLCRVGAASGAIAEIIIPAPARGA